MRLNSVVSTVLLAAAATVQAATVTYDFNVTWVLANPDGALVRPVIGINGAWPLPTMVVDVGDRVVVNVNNQLGNQTTSLHFHGLFMKGTPHMDGPAGVSQCAIPPGSSFTYNFTVGPFQSIFSPHSWDYRWKDSCMLGVHFCLILC